MPLLQVRADMCQDTSIHGMLGKKRVSNDCEEEPQDGCLGNKPSCSTLNLEQFHRDMFTWLENQESWDTLRSLVEKPEVSSDVPIRSCNY